jgi:hypothetical protein
LFIKITTGIGSKQTQLRNGVPLLQVWFPGF